MEPSQRVEIVIPVRTLLALLAFGVLVLLAVVSVGTLLSIFVVAVIALGLDLWARSCGAAGVAAVPRWSSSPRCSQPSSRSCW